MKQSLTLRRPDDWHLHCRDGQALLRTVTDACARFGRALIMPNLLPPITDVAIAQDYRHRIIQATPHNSSFTPLISLYLTHDTNEAILQAAKASGFIVACKLYPAGATTHSNSGISDIKALYSLLATMQELELVLNIHGEVANPEVDIFDRESHFIDDYLDDIIKQFPKLRIVLEHISTEFAVKYIEQAPNNLAATITPHHLLLNRNHLLADNLRPHLYCKPIVKRHSDQQALIQAAISGNQKFFLGSDSAPHAISQKESACGCAGIYSSHAAIEFYAQVFADHGALNRLEAFASLFGADFYQLPHNTETITLINKPWQIPAELSFGAESLVPLGAQQSLDWQLISE